MADDLQNFKKVSTWSLLTAAFCSVTGGLIAAMAAGEAERLCAAGDIDGARFAARRARKWILISIALSMACLATAVHLTLRFILPVQ